MRSVEMTYPESGYFLFRKAVFVLTSSIGQSMAENLLRTAAHQIGSSPESLIREDIRPLAGALQPNLSEFVGNNQAAKLTSALRVLVGGVAGI
jgi:hypothetical protein